MKQTLWGERKVTGAEASLVVLTLLIWEFEVGREGGKVVENVL